MNRTPGQDPALLPSPPDRPHEAGTLRVRFNGPEEQLVDLDSRFGVWWDSESPYFGIDHGAMACQREGKKSFMVPLARLGVLDEESGTTLFAEPGNLARPRTTCYPWGLVQEGEVEDIRLRVTAAYAALDVVAIKVEVQNGRRSPRRLRLSLRAWVVPEDWNRSIVFRAEAGEVIATQTSAPTSRYRIRPEPHIDLVTGWRVDFGIARRNAEGGGFAVEGDAFSLATGQARVFSLYVSAASSDSDSASWLAPLVRARLAAQMVPADDAIRAARQRWEEIFGTLPVGDLDEETRRVVQGAATVLLRNTLRPQPEQMYGRLMGPFRGTFPCRGSYEGFWVWDSALQALGLAEWDLGLAKDNIRLLLHNQDHDGALPMLHPDARVNSANPPLFSWVVMEVFAKERAGDPNRARAFLEEVYEKLARWNRWWFRRRDKNGNGLAEWGSNLESGWDDSPRWDNDDGAAGWGNDFGCAAYEAVDLNSYLIKDMRSLARMADALDRAAERDRWNQEADALAQLVVDVLYDARDNLFYDTNYATGERRKLLTPACFLPLWAGVPLPDDRARGMIEAYLLSAEHFFGEYPFPTVSYREAAHDASGQSGYWRGPVWLNIAYFMIEVLAWHGYRGEAREGSRRVLEMVRRAGIHENYHSGTGGPGTHSNSAFSWSAAMVIAIALRDLTHAPPPPWSGPFAARPIHLGVRVRDRKIYGRGKEAWLHLANRTGQSVSGALQFQLPEGWRVLSHRPSAGPEEGWIDASGGLTFWAEPEARQERPIRFVVPGSLGDREYDIGVAALTADHAPACLGRTVLRLEGPPMAPLPWLSGETAAALRGLLHVGGSFHFTHDDREIGRSGPGLIGMMDGRLLFLGRQALAGHIARRDFIRHALHLLGDRPAGPLRRELESLLEPGASSQDADEEARELLETVVQQTRDLTGG